MEDLFLSTTHGPTRQPSLHQARQRHRMIPVADKQMHHASFTTLFFDLALDFSPGQFVMLWIPGLDEKRGQGEVFPESCKPESGRHGGNPRPLWSRLYHDGFSQSCPCGRRMRHGAPGAPGRKAFQQGMPDPRSQIKGSAPIPGQVGTIPAFLYR